MKANQAMYPVTTMSKVLRIPRATFYAWLKRQPCIRDKNNAELTERIRAIHDESNGSYGAPRIHEALKTQCAQTNESAPGRNRVARLMKEAQIAGITRRRPKKPKTTKQDPRHPSAPDLVQRDFTASAPDRLWVADITYVPTRSGWLFLAVVLDVFSRKIVGWSMATHLRTELVLDALDMAVKQRRPTDVIHHSDKGCQYTSYAFGKRCEHAGIRPSTGTAGDCYDNSMAESFFATLECELLDPTSFDNPGEAALAIFQFIEGWYNTRRLHSALDYCAPVDYELQHQSLQQTPMTASPDLSI
jgi:putative transposase